jgi:hypothetical protein
VAAQRRAEAAQAEDEAGAAAAGSALATTGVVPGTGPRSYPVPPMDLPHYHGVGLGGQDDPVATPGGPGDPGSTANGTSKEVSGV